VQGNQEVFRALAASQRDLASLVTTFNSTMAALSARQNELQQTISLLPPLLRVTQTSDSALDRSFPPTKAFARALLPSISKLDPTIGLGLPWLAQSTQLMSSRELGGLVRYLTPAIQNTGATITTTKALVKQADLLGRCFEHNIVPTGNQRIKDPPSTTGLRVYQELFQSGVGIASATQGFDGNGRYLRASAGGGSILTQTSGKSIDGPLFGHAVLQPLGTRPAFPGSPPPVRSDVACFKNAAPNLNKVVTGGTP
jgi:phospholipid/cholesterol/gamma-HCH transport system substrate-binding protein